MPIHKSRRSGYAGPPPSADAATDDHDVAVTEADVSGSAFAIDLVIAELATEGIEVVRSSPFQEARQMGRLSGIAQHKLVFRTADGERVAAAFREAGVI